MSNVKEISHFITRAEGIKDPHKKRFALSLIQFMEENGIETLNALAEKLQVKRQTITNWMYGGTLPDGTNLVHVSKITGYEFDHLIGNMEEKDHDAHFICNETGLSEDAVNCLRDKWRASNEHRAISLPDLISMMLESPDTLTALTNIIHITLNDQEYISVAAAENFDRDSDYYVPVKPPKSGLRRMFFEEIITELNRKLDDRITELDADKEKIKAESDRIFEEKIKAYEQKKKTGH